MSDGWTRQGATLAIDALEDGASQTKSALKDAFEQIDELRTALDQIAEDYFFHGNEPSKEAIADIGEALRSLGYSHEWALRLR